MHTIIPFCMGAGTVGLYFGGTATATCAATAAGSLAFSGLAFGIAGISWVALVILNANPILVSISYHPAITLAHAGLVVAKVAITATAIVGSISLVTLVIALPFLYAI